MAELKVPTAPPVIEGRATRAEMSKSYPKIQSDFRKFEVRAPACHPPVVYKILQLSKANSLNSSIYCVNRNPRC